MAGSLTGVVNGQYWADLLSQKLGYPVYSGEPYYTSGCTSSSQCVLPNAYIPQSAWSAPDKALLPYIPQPNQAGNMFSTSKYNETLRDDKGAFRIDVNTRWGSLSGYYFLDDYSLNSPYPNGSGRGQCSGVQCHDARARAAAESRHHKSVWRKCSQRIAFQLHARCQ
jgi:hypothetical protein